MRINTLRAGITVCLIAASVTVAGPSSDTLKIMALGDSRTAGPTSRDCYRLYLDRMMSAAGYAYDFVGTLTTHENNTRPADSVFDADHEGHWGWAVDKLLWDTWAHIGTVGSWVREGKPDIVLAMLGTTDILQESDSTKYYRTFNEIRATIDTLRACNPRVVILLTNLYPAVPVDYTVQLFKFDSLMPGLVAATYTDSSPVLYINLVSGFNIATDMVDIWHANRQGCTKIATKFLNALWPFFDTIPPPTATTPDLRRMRPVARLDAGWFVTVTGIDITPSGLYTATGRRISCQSMERGFISPAITRTSRQSTRKPR